MLDARGIAPSLCVVAPSRSAIRLLRHFAVHAALRSDIDCCDRQARWRGLRQLCPRTILILYHNIDLDYATLHKLPDRKMHISDIYASQMDELACGYALWCPDGHDNADEIEIADVGYIEEGAFIELFNAKYPAGHPRNSRKQVPTGHEPFDWKTILYNEHSDDMDPGVYSSKSVHHKKTAASAGA